jgi:hypothetical protein
VNLQSALYVGVNEHKCTLFESFLRGDNNFKVAFLNKGWLLTPPKSLNFVHLLTGVAIHHALEEVQDDFSLDA